MSRRFFLGFAGGFILFFAINLIAAHLGSDCGLPAIFGRDSCADDIVRVGWPLRFFEEGGFAYRSNFSSLSLMIDMIIGVLFSIFIGWGVARSKKTPPK